MVVILTPIVLMVVGIPGWFETDSEMFPWMNLFAMKKVHNSNCARDFDAKKDVEVFLSYTPVD